MGQQRRGVALQQRLLAQLVARLVGAVVGVERSLGVDHDLHAFGNTDHGIGPAPVLVGADGHLLHEVNMLSQAGELENVA